MRLVHDPDEFIFRAIDRLLPEWSGGSPTFHGIGMRCKDYDWSKEVAPIKSPTMIVFADADAIRPAHIIEFFGLLGGAQKDAGLDGFGRPTNQLAILPGLTHYNTSSSPSLAAVVTPFLDAPTPGAK
jgi:pimeloyl-ACP methyl ester carboxylesterase